MRLLSQPRLQTRLQLHLQPLLLPLLLACILYFNLEESVKMFWKKLKERVREKRANRARSRQAGTRLSFTGLFQRFRVRRTQPSEQYSSHHPAQSNLVRVDPVLELSSSILDGPEILRRPRLASVQQPNPLSENRHPVQQSLIDSTSSHRQDHLPGTPQSPYTEDRLQSVSQRTHHPVFEDRLQSLSQYPVFEDHLQPVSRYPVFEGRLHNVSQSPYTEDRLQNVSHRPQYPVFEGRLHSVSQPPHIEDRLQSASHHPVFEVRLHSVSQSPPIEDRLQSSSHHHLFEDRLQSSSQHPVFEDRFQTASQYPVFEGRLHSVSHSPVSEDRIENIRDNPVPVERHVRPALRRFPLTETSYSEDQPISLSSGSSVYSNTHIPMSPSDRRTAYFKIKEKAEGEAQQQEQAIRQKLERKGLQFPPYRFLEIIGKGAFGRVYKW